MFKYKIINKPKDFKVDKKIVDYIFSQISENIQKSQNWTLNMVFLPDSEIQKLNKQYRWIDSTTDVLSFHYFYDFSDLKQNETAWEIILSESKIRSQSKEFSNTLEKEFYKLIIHSILHVLGYDHEEDTDYENMKKEEEKIVESVFDSFWVKIL